MDSNRGSRSRETAVSFAKDRATSKILHLHPRPDIEKDVSNAPAFFDFDRVGDYRLKWMLSRSRNVALLASSAKSAPIGTPPRTNIAMYRHVIPFSRAVTLPGRLRRDAALRARPRPAGRW
jgi:hypothetical protein